MSYIEQNLPGAYDRLGLLLDHAHGLCMALSCEDFDNINPEAKGGLYDCLLHVVIDARRAHTAMLDEHVQKGLRT